ncbi:MAG: DUF4129 domain-containing protein [Planctomyces sp.]
MARLICGMLLLQLCCDHVSAQTSPNVPAPNNRGAVVRETPSQRWLPLPQNNANDQTQQFQMLRQLQKLLTAGTGEADSGTTDAGKAPEPSARPEAGSEKLPSFGGQQLEQLRQLLKSSGFLNSGSEATPGNKTPGGMNPEAAGELQKLMTDPLMQQQISKAWSDPGLRRQVREMLEKYSKDRTLPQPNSGTSSNGLPGPNSPDSASSAEDGLDKQRGAIEELMKNPAMQGQLGELLKQMMQVQQEVQGESPLPEGLIPEMLRNNSEISDLFAPKTVPEAPLSNRKSPGNLIPNSPQRNSGSDINKLAPERRRETPGRGNGNGLQNRPGQPQQLPPELFNPGSSTPLPGGSSFPEGSSPSGSIPPIDIDRELQRKGFGRALQDLIRQGAAEGRNRPDAGQSVAPGVEGSGGTGAAGTPGSSSGTPDAAGKSPATEETTKSLIRMLDGFRKDIQEMAKDEKPESQSQFSPSPPAVSPSERSAPAPSPRSSQQNRAAEQSPASPGQNSGGSMLGDATKWLGDVLSDISKPSRSSNESARNSSSSESGELPLGGSEVSTVLLTLAGGALVWMLLGRLRRRFMTADTPLNLDDLKVDGTVRVRSREDIVRIFHQLARARIRNAQSWWTHTEVRRRITQGTPERTVAFQTLTELYEQARYLPPDAPFSEEQLSAAGRAIEQCEVMTA